MKKGKARQTFMAVTEPSAVDGSPSHEIVKFASINPREVRSPLMMPKGASISTQIMPATVGASSQGTISSPRAIERKVALRRWLRSNASARPITRCSATLKKVKITVCRSDFQNSGSLSRVR